MYLDAARTQPFTSTGGYFWYSGGIGIYYTFTYSTKIENDTYCTPTTTTTSTTTSTTTIAPTTSTTTTTTTQEPTTTTSTTTTTTTQEPTTTTSTTTTTTTSNEVSIYINNTNSLDVPITDMTINGVSVTFVGGSNFTITAGNNGSFSSTQTGTQTVIIYYGGHTSGQNIAFTDSDSTVSCQNLNGSAGSFTISNAIITGGTTIYVTVSDGTCS